MATDDKHRATAAAILPLVGGASNIGTVAHCMTRLRLGLLDPSLVDAEALKALPAVMGVVEDDTYQIVLGPGSVARVTPEFEALVEEARASAPAPVSGPAAPPTPAPTPAGPQVTAGPPATAGPQVTAEELAVQGAELRAARKAKNATPFKLFLRKIANIFVPLIPALIGCGIIAGLNGLLVNLGWLPGVTPALAAIASGFMALIAVFVGYNTAKEFGGTPILGGAVAAIIVFPGVANIDAFGQKLSPGQGGVLGALGAAVLAVYVEKWCRRWVPETLDVLVTPTLTVLISGLVTIFGLMYVAGEVSSAIGTAADWLLSHGGAGAGFLLGGFFLPLVMLGLHQALIPIHTTLIEQQGYTVLLPILAMAGAGQVGAATAVYVRLPRNESIRRTIKSALPAGLLGVGEPLIYGVSLPLGRPFITACVGGAFGGGFVGLFNQLGTSVGSTAIGPSGWALFPLLDGNHGLGGSLAIYAGGLLVGYVAGFVATYFFGFSKDLLAEFNVSQEAAAAGAGTTTVVAGSAGGANAPASTDPGSSDPGSSDPGSSDPGSSDPGSSDPGSSDPGSSDPGSSDPGSSDPGQRPSPAKV